MNELAEIVQTNNLDKKDGDIIIDKFGQYEQIADEWKAKAKAIVVTDRNQVTEMAMAKTARIKFSNMRIELEKSRKAIGDPAYRKYKAVNAVAKYLQTLIKPIEDHLKLQEDFVKNDDARIAAEKKVEDERMIEAERIAKEKADEKERERLRVENENLQAKAEALEEEMRLEREKASEEKQALEAKAEKEKQKLRDDADAELLKVEAKNRKEAKVRERALDIERQKADSERRALEARARIASEAKEKLEREVKAKDDARIKEDAQREKERAEALKAPDKEKYVAYVNALLHVTPPDVQDAGIGEKIQVIRDYLQTK